ncbi:biotin carboxylase N-terminal domain-containing protein [Pseudonocardia sp. N23]|uniref:biotin carboxylase N-terminal domain-containing protein n=1 Tax=Pseudonocardia sp. N23 TaxID=1987376 RepID=UPI0035B5DB75
MPLRARQLGLANDAGSLHARRADDVVHLPGAGPAAHLDGPPSVGAAASAGVDAIHPGYGFSLRECRAGPALR